VPDANQFRPATRGVQRSPDPGFSNEENMKAVILAGGLGTRLSEETATRPKPMVEIGGKPILWHILKMYSHHGINDFVICCGYKGYVIKEYFANYFLHTSDVTFDMRNNRMEVHSKRAEPWTVTLVDTGDASMTGGRLRRVADYVKDEEAFCFTYGDGISDIDISASVAFHKAHGKEATVTATFPPGRFGALEIRQQQVLSFQEKPRGDGAMINGGFFVLSPSVLRHIDGDDSTWEQVPLMKLAADGQLMAFEHSGFWQPMDTLRDKHLLEDLWAAGKAPWKKWE
jgi:glucose-1-phosphate cytidylyltransferase